MNRWPKNKPKTEIRIALEYKRSANPVTSFVLQRMLFEKSLNTRNCFHKLTQNKFDKAYLR